MYSWSLSNWMGHGQQQQLPKQRHFSNKEMDAPWVFFHRHFSPRTYSRPFHFIRTRPCPLTYNRTCLGQAGQSTEEGRSYRAETEDRGRKGERVIPPFTHTVNGRLIYFRSTMWVWLCACKGKSFPNLNVQDYYFLYNFPLTNGYYHRYIYLPKLHLEVYIFIHRQLCFMNVSPFYPPKLNCTIKSKLIFALQMNACLIQSDLLVRWLQMFYLVTWLMVGL